MSSSETSNATGARPCPKRLWVLATLSDDEALPPDGSLPPGLKFHLSRCPSCRLDADRLMAVSGSLMELSEETPPVEILVRADERLEFALSHGAILSGRVSIPKENPDDCAEFNAPVIRLGVLSLTSRFAAAAVLAFALGWAGIAFFDFSRREGSSPSPSRRMATPGVAISESIDKGIVSQQDQDTDQVMALSEDEYEPRPFCSVSLESGDELGRDTRCIQRAFSLPIRNRNGLESMPAPTPFDNPRPPLSTTHLPNER